MLLHVACTSCKGLKETSAIKILYIYTYCDTYIYIYIYIYILYLPLTLKHFLVNLVFLEKFELNIFLIHGNLELFLEKPCICLLKFKMSNHYSANVVQCDLNFRKIAAIKISCVIFKRHFFNDV